MSSKNEYHSPGVRIGFQIKYNEEKPNGSCVPNVDISSTSERTTMSKTTETTTASPTSTAKPSTTVFSTVQSSTMSSTDSFSTSTSQTATSTTGATYQAQINYIGDPWPENGNNKAKGACVLPISSKIDNIKVKIAFNTQTVSFQQWVGTVLSSSDVNGQWYDIQNSHAWDPPSKTVEFIVEYNANDENPPTGYCIFYTNGQIITTQSTLTSSKTNTAKPTSSSASTNTASSSAQSQTTTAQSTTKQPGTTVTPGSSRYNYGDVMKLSILFYEAQRSGKLPNDNRVSWRADSCLDDKGVNNEDLAGGWYDAGDGVKFNFPMASSTTLLTWGLVQWKDAYVSSDQLDNMYDSIKWTLDYFLKCWKNDKLYGQVGDGHVDHASWTRPEDYTMARPAFYLNASNPGSDLAGETAAALAAGAIAFKTEGLSCILGYDDELCFGAAMLYKATGNNSYLEQAKSYARQKIAWGLSWDDKTVACQLLLFEATYGNTYKTQVESFVKSYLPGGSVQQTNCGLAWLDQWGALRYSANAAFVALMAADMGIGNADQYKTFAMSQIHYMIGENNKKLSYVIGYGSNYPKKPHHRASSCPALDTPCDWNDYESENDNPHVLTGALVGGPDKFDAYEDQRNDYIKNEVATDYNAGFQSTLAGLQHFAINNKLPQAPTLPCA
ncbi:hypothetical protein KUTeg_016485 [Tegillarca granosa]|uniref:Endoglucanase n=1 Tax=Tegillarca granosa TaxID=220873 RepID=A0ABQ9ER98_TEGGR|nr:hypothetical protein KUTeg_016485 [Tegillarca granosa]